MSVRAGRQIPFLSPGERPLENLEALYGSDQHGLVWAFRFAPGEAPVPVNTDDVTAWLASAPAASSGSFVWMHFSLANAASERWLRRSLSLPSTFFDSISELAASTRVEEDGEALVAVIHDVLLDPASSSPPSRASNRGRTGTREVKYDLTFDPEAVATVHLCLTERMLVTVRLRPVRSVDALRADARAGKVFRSVSHLLAQFLRHQAGVLADIVRRATLQVDLIEDNLLANRIPADRRALGTLRRTLVRLQRLLAPEPTALFRLLESSPEFLSEDDLQDLRQATEEFSAVIADSGTLVERAKSLQEELTALVAEQTNRTLFVLTVCTVLALPVNMIAGLFGMNVGGVPFASNQAGFYIVVAVLIILTGVAAQQALGRRRE